MSKNPSATIEVWGDGENVRDYIYIEDLINIIIKFIDIKFIIIRKSFNSSYC